MSLWTAMEENPAFTRLMTWLVLEGELTAGGLLVFLSYLRAAFKPLANFTKYSGRVAKASAASDRVM